MNFEIPREIKKEAARILGLKKRNLFDAFYRVTNGDMTTRFGFENPFGIRIVTPDWDPNPDIDCGSGLHFVWGHPLLALFFIRRTEPRFFKIPKERIEELIIPHDSRGKIRADAYTLFRGDELGPESPEFSDEILRRIALRSINADIRKAATKILVNQRVLARIARRDEERYVRFTAVGKITNQGVLQKIAQGNGSCIVREAAVRRMTDQNQRVLQRIAERDTYWKVRETAVLKINDPSYLQGIAEKDKDENVRRAAKERIRELSFV